MLFIRGIRLNFEFQAQGQKCLGNIVRIDKDLLRIIYLSVSIDASPTVNQFRKNRKCRCRCKPLGITGKHFFVSQPLK